MVLIIELVGILGVAISGVLFWAGTAGGGIGLAIMGPAAVVAGLLAFLLIGVGEMLRVLWMIERRLGKEAEDRTATNKAAWDQEATDKEVKAARDHATREKVALRIGNMTYLARPDRAASEAPCRSAEGAMRKPLEGLGCWVRAGGQGAPAAARLASRPVSMASVHASSSPSSGRYRMLSAA